MKRLRGGFLIGLGYMLSPLSWWNDLFFNLPIAYAVGYAVGWFYPNWFLPATVIGYWLSNVLGFIFMQIGVGDMIVKDKPRQPKKDLLISLGLSTAYTLAVVALVQFHILKPPDVLITQTLQP